MYPGNKIPTYQENNIFCSHVEVKGQTGILIGLPKQITNVGNVQIKGYHYFPCRINLRKSFGRLLGIEQRIYENKHKYCDFE